MVWRHTTIITVVVCFLLENKSMMSIQKYTPVFLGLMLFACSNHNIQKSVPKAPVKVLKKVYYDGISDDLLTAGLGLAGLRSSAPILPEQPTAAELRKSSYYHQYKALNDLSVAGGFGVLYGFSEQQLSIAGYEFWTQRRITNGVFHTLVMQLPDGFDVENACLVVAASSGSRNVLGAVGTSGSWALTHGCAVVYTDKGTGTQVALTDGYGYQIDGLISNSGEQLEATALETASSYHVVQKHAYSQVNPEQYWGEFVLDASQFGLDLLMQEKGLIRKDVKVIAASVSNGGGAVLRAAEIDQFGLIDAVVAAEPQVNLTHQYELKDSSGSKSIRTKPLLELSMNLSLYEPCAALDESLNDAPFKMNTVLIQALQQSRCHALQQNGYLVSTNLAEQSREALHKITQLNIEKSALQMSQLNTLANMWGAINHTYSNSYLQTSAADNLCQSAISAFTAQGLPRALSENEKVGMFSLSSGIVPSNGMDLAFTDSNNEVQSKMILAAGFGFASQHCFYQLLGNEKMQLAFDAIEAHPEKNQVPTLILHGQADGTVAVNHASRAYYHRNQSSEMANQTLRYYEIENVQHFDAFLAYPGFDQKFVPMHPYFEQALDLMYAHLFSKQPLPESQLIKTQARGLDMGQVPALNQDHIPRIEQQATQLIKVNQQQLEIE